MTKYNAKRVYLDNVWFDSQAEARRYSQLCLLEKAGEIVDLRVHPRYELESPFTDAIGERHRAIYYIGDFEYKFPHSGQVVCEDVKGVETPVFRLKAHMFARRYPHIKLEIVKGV